VIGIGTDAVYAARLMRRAIVLWLPLRVIILGLAMSFGLDPRPGAAGTMLMAAVAASLCSLDARALREPIFHANLGTPPWAPAVAGASVAVCLEVIVMLIQPMLRA
jgi:hypothetical protein